MKKIEVIRCSSCGSSTVENIGNNIGKCKHCGSTMLLPRQNEEIVSLLNAAYVYRENFNYDLAIKSYQFVLEKDSNELSAYEGILLSKYGIEYVKDSYTGKLVPTCHRAHFKSIFEDDYYKTLITLANDQQKQVIEAKAKEIDILQKAIERQLQNEQEYDVFISYKATDKNGEKTEDSVIAREIYEELTKKNYRVFLAEKSLENRIGSEYEPIIFKALHTSSVFILVGTSKENVEANWVRNEWSRFIDRIKNNENLPSGCFIPVFKGMNPYDMPKINNTFVQGVDASKLGYAITIVDGVSKMLKPEEEKKIIDVLDNVENFSEFENLQKRKKLELKKKHWEELKKSKGPKKYAYFAFLYSPYLLGALSVLFSLLIATMFITRPEFIIFICLFITTLTMTIVTFRVQLKKYILKPLFHIVIPFAIIIISLSTYFIRLCLIPMDAIDRPPIANMCSENYSNGIVYEKYKDEITGKTTGHLTHILEFKRKDFIKTIDNKKYLFVPETVNGYTIDSASIYVYEGIDAVVVPKECLSFTIYFYENPTSLVEIYAYNPTYANMELMVGTWTYPINRHAYKHIKFYYEKHTYGTEWTCENNFNRYNYPENVIQQEIKFYH